MLGSRWQKKIVIFALARELGKLVLLWKYSSCTSWFFIFRILFSRYWVSSIVGLVFVCQIRNQPEPHYRSGFALSIDGRASSVVWLTLLRLYWDQISTRLLARVRLVKSTRTNNSLSFAAVYLFLTSASSTNTAVLLRVQYKSKEVRGPPDTFQHHTLKFHLSHLPWFVRLH